MERDGGVYKIPCLVNGAKMKLVFDTGASHVCLSKGMASYLLENDYLSVNDFIGTSKSLVADGRVVDNLDLNIRDLEISGLHLRNVEAIVSESQSAPLLLGLSAISKLGKIEIEGNRLRILSGSSGIDAEDKKQELCENGSKCYYVSDYSGTIEYLEEAQMYGDLNQHYLGMLFESYVYGKKASKALSLFNKINPDSQISENVNIYGVIADMYSDLERYPAAISYYKKALTVDIPSNNEKYKSSISYTMGLLYDILGQYSYSMQCYNDALTYICSFHGIAPQVLYDECFGKSKDWRKQYRNSNTDAIVYRLIVSMNENGKLSGSSFSLYICVLAENGNQLAIKHCANAGINYSLYLRNYRSLYGDIRL